MVVGVVIVEGVVGVEYVVFIGRGYNGVDSEVVVVVVFFVIFGFEVGVGRVEGLVGFEGYIVGSIGGIV